MVRWDALLVALGVGRACVQCAEVATLATEDLLCRLFVCVESGGEVFLLLLNVVERLVDIGLFPLSRENGSVQTLNLCGKRLIYIKQGDEAIIIIARTRTLFPFSIKARSQTCTSLANLLNSRTCVSRS